MKTDYEVSKMDIENYSFLCLTKSTYLKAINTHNFSNDLHHKMVSELACLKIDPYFEFITN